jgi:hypothetical protein
VRELKRTVSDYLGPVNGIWPGEWRELAPGSGLLASIEEGETELSDVEYHTFGGTNPRLVRLYVWLYDPITAVWPHTKTTKKFPFFKVYWTWTAHPVELDPISPVFDKLRALIPIPEIRGGADGLVTNEHAQLPAGTFPNASHKPRNLNHFEVMWDTELQDDVLRILVASP